MIIPSARHHYAVSDDQRVKLPIGFLIKVALVGLCVMAVAVTISWLRDAPIGTMADWIAGLSTFAAFIAAVIAGKFAYDALTIEQARDRFRDKELRRAEEKQRRAQAELMTAWVEQVLYAAPTDGVGPSSHDVEVTSVNVKLRNGSHLAITNIRIVVSHFVIGQPTGELLCEMTLPLLEPDSVYMHGSAGLVIAKLTGPPDRERGAEVDLTFTDAAGQRWRRHGFDEVNPVPVTGSP